jgi:hypothetical protein
VSAGASARDPALLAALLAALLVCSSRVFADGPEGTSVTYNREVAPILERSCVPCHARGDDVPLETYPDTRPWAQAIREEVLERRMPPWSAAHGVQPLANDLHLSPREIAILVAWADGGTPRGAAADRPARLTRPRWPAGAPSVTLPVPPPRAPADGRLHVRRVTLPTRLDGESWLRGFDLVPEGRGARAAFLFLAEKGTAREQWLGGWTPWHAMTRAPDGVAHRLPAGAVLVLEIHGLAAPGGTRPIDGGELGLYLATTRPSTPARSLDVVAAADAMSGPRPLLRGGATLDEDTVVWALRPWLAGATGPVEVAVLRPDGALEPLVWITDHRPEWPTPYVLYDPARLSKGSRLIVTAYPKATGESPVSAGALVLAYPSGAATTRGVSPAAGAPRR